MIVDDHPMVRERLAALINQQHDLVTCAEVEDRHQALAAIKQFHPAIALVDLKLRHTSGLDLIKDIQAQHPSLPVLVISMYDESVFAERALRAGARGYIGKDEPTETVIAAIRRILEGGTYLSERMSSTMVRAYVTGKTAQQTDSLERLTDRELHVLELIGQGVSTRRIAETLHIDSRTVETYRARIKEKLDIKNSTELLMRAVEWVHKNGPPDRT